ncbi:MAG: RNA 2',3'-cyclic phosphodiesterase [Candidatus Diapherotrites archaeon]
MRAFIALNISDKGKTEIENILSLIDENKFRKVKKENLHITMRFLDEINEENADEIKKKIQKIKFKEFEIELNGIKSFGTRVLWIDVIKGKEKIIELNKKLDSAGIKDKKFHPHLTIARNKNASLNEINSLIEKLNKQRLLVKEKIFSIDLMKSELKAGRPEYNLL